MFSTTQFRTKTIIEKGKRKNPTIDGVWPIAIDVGYSSVDVFSPNAAICFPSFAKKLMKGQEFLGREDKRNILYEDENGERWLVGANAQNMVAANDTTTSTSGLFVRDRFFSPMFKVITRVGFALGMRKNQFGDPVGKTLVVQTGLPPRHMEEYEDDIKEAFAGEHSFRVKVGDHDWQTFKFFLPDTNVSVMAQPMGALISVSTDTNGGQLPDASKYLTSNVLVLDPGFGTCDTFNICGRKIVNNNTWDDLGMNRILSDTCFDIFERFHEEITVPAMQKYLETGVIRVKDRKTRTSKTQAFADILEINSKKVCDEVLQTIDENYDGLFNHDYLIITGGLGEAWYSRIKNAYSNMDTLTIIPGNINDPELEGIFSNVRGYYMSLLNSLKNAYR